MQEAPQFPADNKLWNVRQAADYLNTTAQGVYKLVERRQIPHVRLGRKVLFDPTMVRAWVQKHLVEGAA